MTLRSGLILAAAKAFEDGKNPCFAMSVEEYDELSLLIAVLLAAVTRVDSDTLRTILVEGAVGLDNDPPPPGFMSSLLQRAAALDKK